MAARINESSMISMTVRVNLRKDFFFSKGHLRGLGEADSKQKSSPLKLQRTPSPPPHISRNGVLSHYFFSRRKGERVQYWEFCQQTRLQRKDRKKLKLTARDIHQFF